MKDLKEQLIKSFDENIINLNGKEYVSIDVFQSAVSEIAVLESLIGSIALRFKKDIFISEEETIDYIIDKHEKVYITYNNGIYVIKSK